MSGSEVRVVLVGWGAIGQRVAALLAARHPPRIRLCAVAVRGEGARDGLPPRAALITDPSALADLRPSLVVEAAGRAAVGPWGRAALAAGADFAPASTSAFTDAGMLADLTARATAAGRQILIAPGALGGIDALAAASRLGLTQVRHEIVKPPAAWAGTGAEGVVDLASLKTPTTFFEGSAEDAARAYPQNANVAMITALAGVGPAQTRIALVADPGAVRNGHRVTATGDFGTLTITLENRALASNPKSSELTALSLVRLIENRAAALVI